MNQRRIEIGAKLKTILGNSNTYFQPPVNTKLNYPCAIYSKDGVNSRNANDSVYAYWDRYSVTFITNDPDNTYYEGMVDQFTYVRFDRRFISEGLYHDVYTIY